MSRPLLSRWLRLMLTAALLLSVSVVAVFVTPRPADAAAVGGQERIAYYGNWDIYGNKYFLRDVDRTGTARQLTTLVYSFENIDPSSLKCFEATHAVDVDENNPNGGDGGGDAWGDYQRPFTAAESVNGQADTANQALKGGFNQVKQLKARNPNLKVLISIGGWTFSKFFSDAAASATSRAAFVSSCIDLFIKGNLPTGVGGQPEGGAGAAAGIFDGIDIDWEFPANTSGDPSGHKGNHVSSADTSNYVALMAEFSRQLSGLRRSNGAPYLLTAAVQADANAPILSKASQLLQYLNWAGVMTYDMHGAWDSTGPTNFQAPLYGPTSGPQANDHLSVDEAMKRWQASGWPANKLVVGVPFYWRGWSGVPNLSDGLYQSATGPSRAYPITNQAGVANYKEMVTAGTMRNLHYDPFTHSPWIYDNGTFYTGDTPNSLIEKGAYIRNNGYKGAMVYALEGDDPSATLMKALTKGLNGGSPPPVAPPVLVTAAARTSLSSANSATNGEPINMVGGNFLLTRSELKLPSADNPVEFTLNYNSAVAEQLGSVGWGWTHSFRITALPDSDGSIVVQAADGRMDRYTSNGSGGFTPPPGTFDSLSLVSGALQLTRKDRRVYRFTSSGAIGSITSPNGNTVTFGYDSNELLTTVTDPVGRKLTLAYDAQNMLTSVTDPAARIIRYSYDELGNLTTVKNAAGLLTSYTYDTAHRLATMTDPRSNVVVRNTYDDQGRVTRQVNGLGDALSLAYTAGQTTYTDARGGTTVYSYDDQLRITKTQNQVGAVTARTYDAAGNLAKTTDARGGVTTRAYDGRGNLTQSTDPAGGVQKFTYSAQDDLLTRVDQLGRVTTYTYDARGNVTQRTDPAGNLTKLTYDAAGRPISVTDPLSNVAKFGYDAIGNLITRTDASGRVTTLSYDAVGRLTSTTDPDGDTKTFSLDPMDHLTKIVEPSGTPTSYSFDADGNTSTQTDGNGHATAFEYDANNSLIKTTNALGKATAYSYDTNGNLTKVTDARGSAKTYTYDPSDRQIQSTNALGDTTNVTYDPNGNLASRTDASGRKTTYSYDSLDRLSKVTYPDATTSRYTYDAVSNVLTVTNSAGTTTKAYDALDRLTSVKDPHGAIVTYSYDAANELRQVKYPDGKLVNYTYTPAKQLSTAADWNNAVTTYLYDNEGRVSAKRLPNSVTGTYSYDVNGRLTDLVYKKGATKLTSFNYTRDSVGNVTEDEELKADGTESYSEYSYDAIDQLTMDDAPAHTWKYAYDAVGNMSNTTADNTSTTMTYNSANQLLAKGSRTLTYDKQGNQVTDGSRALAYNFDNRLKSFTLDGVTTSYVYDGTGNRIEKNGSSKFQYVNAGNNNMLVAKNVTGGTSSFNLFGVDLISQGGGASGERQYFLTDGFGNVKYLTNSSGSTVSSYSYDPFGGNQTASGGTGNSYLYQEEQRDSESGLVFLRARYLDPSTGRFVSADPFKGTLVDPKSQNGYSYANQNPVNLHDPLGLWSWELTSTILGGVSAVTGVAAVALAVTGVGAPVAVVLEGVSLASGVGATAIDCRKSVNVQCGIDAVATAAGGVGVGARVAGQLGKIGSKSVEMIDLGFGLQAVDFGIPAAILAIADYTEKMREKPQACSK